MLASIERRPAGPQRGGSMLPVVAVIEPRASLDIQSHSGELARVRAFVRDFCATLPILGRQDEAWLDELELVVQEATTNIMRHAYAKDPDRDIRCELSLEGDRLTVALLHHGAPLDAAPAPNPVFDGSASGGFGLFIIEELTDTVAYDRDPGGRHRVRMEKVIKKGRASDEAFG